MSRIDRKIDMIKLTVLLFALLTNAKRVTFAVKDQDIAGFQPYRKMKGGSMVYEDFSMLTKNFCLVSDGVGGSTLSSGYFAKMLVYAFAKSFLDVNYYLKHIEADLDKTESDDILRNIGGEFVEEKINDYNEKFGKTFDDMKDSKPYKTIKNYLLQKITGTLEEEIIVKNYMELLKQTGATILGSYISAHNTDFYLNSFQFGDSSLILFDKFQSESDSTKSYYFPKIISSDMQEKFNTPKQINNYNTEDSPTEENTDVQGQDPSIIQNPLIEDAETGVKSESFNISKLKYNFIREKINMTQILLLASDGLYDNLTVPLITLFLNMFFYIQEKFSIKLK